MIRRALIAVVCTAALLPGVAGAQEAREDEGAAWGEPRDTGVDVSVDVSTPGAQVGFDTFQSGLAPYGDWTTLGGYGQVWRPRVAAGWRPYYYGHWAWTDEGWLWVSDEPWGWGPYHYGRWGWDASYGWFWVPGYQWAPAWVTWRFSGDVVGWSPLWPGWSVYVTNYPVFYGAWTFMPCNRFAGVPVYGNAYAPHHVPGFFGRTVPAPPRAVAYGTRAPAWGGPGHAFVEQRVGRPIPPARIVPVSSPSQAVPSAPRSGAIQVFRPERMASPAPSARPGVAPQPSPSAGTRPGWGSPSRPGFGPPGRVPAPGAAPGSRPPDNRPGFGTPPSRGPAPVPPGPRSGFAAPSGSGFAQSPGRGAAPPQGGYAPSPGRGQATPPGWRGGGLAPPASRGFAAPPAQRGGSYAAPQGPRGGSYAAPRSAPPAGRAGGAPAPASRGGGGHGGRDQHGR